MSHKWKWFPGGVDADCPAGVAWIDDGASPQTKVDPAKDRSRWPVAARWIAALAIDTDRGVGDVVHRLTGRVPGLEDMVALLGNCGCPNRHIRWNEIFPL